MAEQLGDILKQAGIATATESPRAAQWWLLLAVMVANKPADISEKKLIRLLELCQPQDGTPFEKLAWMIDRGILDDCLRTVRTGQYRRIRQAFEDIHAFSKAASDTDPREWTLGLIEGFRGIGPKTARWFYMLVNPTAQVAALDTHILKFLRDNGEPNVPKSTPSKGIVYNRLEQAFLTWAKQLGLIPRDFDFMVWTVYRNKGQITF